MAKQIEMDVAPREVFGKKTKSLRRQGLIPGNIGGHKADSVAIQFDAKVFKRLQHENRAGSIYALNLPGKSAETVLVHHVEHNPVSGEIQHVDFSRVSMDEQVSIKVPLHFVGESPALKDTKGTLLHMDALEVQCRASDILPAIEVDLSPLKTLDDTIYARDVKLPQGFKLVGDPEESVAKVAPPKVELPAPEAAEAAAEAAPAAESESTASE
ncbi:50S ribosomal protein L25 [Ktedonobacter robiniae]|uniref:Large ribosomal subunit protein bL25 n=1 Tax=Ktedonobacter robiniae TaxID=2778365 RepID=A0ABQ3UK22_9CHLR|nr:50S ribosomal protein L25 [Ktedonobacter robiniae]GHO53013.1 50S ribosomal protein L25 [Ktedonobacter robiniae]